MATLEEEYKNYQQTQNTDQINSMYDAQKQSQLAGLESAYNQNLSNAQAARDALPGQYQQRANDLAVQYERQRRNLNEQAAANGLNTGAGSQMQLALGSNYQRDYGGLRTAQQQALNEADRGIRDLQSAYQIQVQQAVANNDFERTQALLAEYQNQYSRQLQQAQTLASYGDFSAYMNIPGYSQGQIDNMRNVWIAENPQLAYNTGAISAEQYYQMTGRWPYGYTPAGTGTQYNPRDYTGDQTKEKDETAKPTGRNYDGNGPVPGINISEDGKIDVSGLAAKMADSPDHGEALFNQLQSSGIMPYLSEAQYQQLAAAGMSTYRNNNSRNEAGTRRGIVGNGLSGNQGGQDQDVRRLNEARDAIGRTVSWLYGKR